MTREEMINKLKNIGFSDKSITKYILNYIFETEEEEKERDRMFNAYYKSLTYGDNIQHKKLDEVLMIFTFELNKRR